MRGGEGIITKPLLFVEGTEEGAPPPLSTPILRSQLNNQFGKEEGDLPKKTLNHSYPQKK